jgi:hypothetical protein
MYVFMLRKFSLRIPSYVISSTLFHPSPCGTRSTSGCMLYSLKISAIVSALLVLSSNLLSFFPCLGPTSNSLRPLTELFRIPYSFFQGYVIVIVLQAGLYPCSGQNQIYRAGVKLFSCMIFYLFPMSFNIG